MSIIDDASKLAQSFLTLDDLVLGQSLVGGGLDQLRRLGTSASGPSVALNVTARAIFLGAQVSSRTAEKAADTVSDVIPMAAETKAIASKLGEKAKALGQRCSTLAGHGIELAGGRKAENPFTKHRWLEKLAPYGYTVGELAADTTFGTLQSLAMMPLSVGMDLVRSASGGKMGASLHKAIDGSFNGVSDASSDADGKNLREGLVALALESGMPVVQSTLGLIEAVARLALSDPRALRRALSEGLQQARLIADKKLGEGRPGMVINSKLRQRAKLVADNPPKAFIAALEDGANGQAPKLSDILSSMVKDRREVVTFFTVYPQVLGLLSSDFSVLLANSLSDTKINKEDLETSAAFTLLDQVGGAVMEDHSTPLFPQATVSLAQDLSYTACRDLLGIDAALERAERLFGKDVAERLACDVSLDPDIMKDEGVREREKRLRDAIKSTDAQALSLQIDLCAQRLAQLESTKAHGALMMTSLLSGRIEVLRAFNSLASTELGLRGEKRSVDPQALVGFLAWASKL
jgi:hypothetical protein